MSATNTTVLSYGGGRQSVAMCLLALRGALPRPDRVVIADTGYEAQSTWDYLREHLQPRLHAEGLEVETAPHSLATVDLYGLNGDLLLPVYTATGKLRTFCSNEWKQAVVQRYLRSTGVAGATFWIGFTLDERRRIKGRGRRPWLASYPLVDLMLTRSDCEAIIASAGLPIPEKSACYICPHRSNEEWRFIRDNYPAQWADATRIDEDVRLLDQRGGVFLHQSRVALVDADLEAPDRAEPDRQCGLGMCRI